MNQNRIGDISEAAITLALMRNGYIISKPIGNQRYDMIADKHGVLLRIQCKTGRKVKGCLVANACVIHGQKKGRKRIKYLPGEIDCFAVYYPETKAVYLIAQSNIHGVDIRLRLEDRKKKDKRPEVNARIYELRY